jgi:hypothetical protein
MQKKFIYIGLVLILIFFVSLFLASSYLFGKLKSSASMYTNETKYIGPGNYSSIQLQIQNISRFILVASPNSSVDFYMFNNTGYGEWQNATSIGNFLALAGTGVGKGVLLVINNSSAVQFPPVSTSYRYEANLSSQPLNQTYYFVFRNPSQKIVSMHLIYLYMGNKIFSVYSTIAPVGFGIFVLLIAGIGFIIFGILKKSKSDAANAEAHGAGSSEEVERLYSGIKQEHAKKHKPEPGSGSSSQQAARKGRKGAKKHMK